MRRAVARGLDRRQLEGLRYLGMDEKSFGRGQSYITLLTDLDQARVLDVVEARTGIAADQLWQTLTPAQKEAVEAVAVDMWEPFIQSTHKAVPGADIVHDKFHISKYLGEAVDKVRRQEHKALLAAGDETLTGTRYLWLYNPEHFNRAELQDPEYQILSPRLPQLSKLPDSHPLLLWKAQSLPTMIREEAVIR